MNSVKYNNNYTNAENIFNNILEWAANKSPSLDKFQITADIEKILDNIEERGYNRGQNEGYNKGRQEGNFEDQSGNSAKKI